MKQSKNKFEEKGNKWTCSSNICGLYGPFENGPVLFTTELLELAGFDTWLPASLAAGLVIFKIC